MSLSIKCELAGGMTQLRNQALDKIVGLSNRHVVSLSLLPKYFSDTLVLSAAKPFQGPPFPVHALLRQTDLCSVPLRMDRGH